MKREREREREYEVLLLCKQKLETKKWMFLKRQFARVKKQDFLKRPEYEP